MVTICRYRSVGQSATTQPPSEQPTHPPTYPPSLSHLPPSPRVPPAAHRPLPSAHQVALTPEDHELQVEISNVTTVLGEEILQRCNEKNIIKT